MYVCVLSCMFLCTRRIDNVGTIWTESEQINIFIYIIAMGFHPIHVVEKIWVGFAAANVTYWTTKILSATKEKRHGISRTVISFTYFELFFFFCLNTSIDGGSNTASQKKRCFVLLHRQKNVCQSIWQSLRYGRATCVHGEWMNLWKRIVQNIGITFIERETWQREEKYGRVLFDIEKSEKNERKNVAKNTDDLVFIVLW